MFLQGPQRPELVFTTLFFDVREVRGHPHHRPSKCLVWLPLWGSGRQVSPHGDFIHFQRKFTHLPLAPSCSQQPCPSPTPRPPLSNTTPCRASPGGPQGPWLWSSEAVPVLFKALKFFSKPEDSRCLPASQRHKVRSGVNSVTGELGGVGGRPSSPSCSPGPVR